MKRNSLYLNENRRLTVDSTQEEVGKVIDLIRTKLLPRSLLVELLSERHPIYLDRPNFEMNRIKGYVMASFSEVGLPDSAINYVLDELQNGRNAYVVAGAARALRGSKRPKAEYVNFLLHAISNLRYHDDSLDLTVFKPSWPLINKSSGKLEIFRTLRCFKGYARAALPELRSFLVNTIDFTPVILEEIQNTIDTIEADKRELDLSCCEIEGKDIIGAFWWWKGLRNIKSIGNLEVENEAGAIMALENIIDKKPTVVAFFYTRCMNPNKCTLTMNKLGWLHKELIKKGLQDKVKLVAFTYDPNYDNPARMRVFGENRGMIFGPNVHALRTRPKDFSKLSKFFQLGVNYVASTINQHRLELFLLNKNGSIKTTYTRLQWEIENIICDLENLVDQPLKSKWISKAVNTSRQLLFPILVAFFPKCPFCWAAYLSAFGISSIQSIPYSPWLVPLFLLVMIFNLIILYIKSKTRNGLTPFFASLLGTIIVGTGYVFSIQIASILGIILVFIGAILNSLSFKHWSKVSLLVSSVMNKLMGSTQITNVEMKTEHNKIYEP